MRVSQHSKSRTVSLLAVIAIAAIGFLLWFDAEEESLAGSEPENSAPAAEEPLDEVLEVVEPEPARSTATEPVEAPEVSDEVASQMEVRVIDQFDRPVPLTPVFLGQTFEAHDNRVAKWKHFGWPVVMTDGLGVARFPVPDGEAIVGIADLRAYQLPWNQECLPGGEGLPMGYILKQPEELVLLPGQTSVTLRCLSGAIIEGHATGRGGTPGKAELLFYPVGSTDNERYDVITNLETGEYCIVLPPGRYEAQFTAITRRSEEEPFNPLEGLVNPMPTCLEVQAGERRLLDGLFGAGRTRYEGRVVDQHGAAWSGVQVRVYAYGIDGCDGHGTQFLNVLDMTLTSADGGYEFDSLPAGTLGLAYRIPGDVFAGPSGIAEYPSKQLVVDDGTQSVIDVGDKVIYRWEPVHLRLKLDLAAGITPIELQTHMTIPTVQPDGEPRRKSFQFRSGVFDLATSSHKPFVLTFEIDGPKGKRTYTHELLKQEPGALPEVVVLSYP